MATTKYEHLSSVYSRAATPSLTSCCLSDGLLLSCCLFVHDSCLMFCFACLFLSCYMSMVLPVAILAILALSHRHSFCVSLCLYLTSACMSHCCWLTAGWKSKVDPFSGDQQSVAAAEVPIPLGQELWALLRGTENPDTEQVTPLYISNKGHHSV